MSSPRLLVAGIGNIFLGDDAFGVEVVRRLSSADLPEDAVVVDFGIRGIDLAYALLDSYEAVVLIDAAPRGGDPGTLYVLELPPTESPQEPCEPVFVETHHLDPARVLQLASSLGARPQRLFLVGCEPDQNSVDPMNPETYGFEMSAAAWAAVDEAVPLVSALVAQLLDQSKRALGNTDNAIEKGIEPCRD
jgi:hydrogenase maturation protease